MKVTRKV